MLTEILQFLSEQGDISGERYGGTIVIILLCIITICIFIYHILDLIFTWLKSISFNRKEKIIKVPEYILSPENKEIDKYLKILKKIANEYENKVQL